MRDKGREPDQGGGDTSSNKGEKKSPLEKEENFSLQRGAGRGSNQPQEKVKKKERKKVAVINKKCRVPVSWRGRNKRKTDIGKERGRSRSEKGEIREYTRSKRKEKGGKKGAICLGKEQDKISALAKRRNAGKNVLIAAQGIREGGYVR